MLAMMFSSRLLRHWRPRLERLEDRSVPAALVALTSDDHLLTFASGSPRTITKNVVVTGLNQGDELHSIARSPQGTLYGIAANPPGLFASFNRLYTLNPATGVATAGPSLSSAELFS